MTNEQNKRIYLFRVKVGGEWYVWDVTDSRTPDTLFGDIDWNTLGQGTTCTDVSGKEVFEGDIVRWELGDSVDSGVGVVHFIEGVYFTGEISDGESFFGFNDYRGYPLEANLRLKIVGNIHDTDMERFKKLALQKESELK